MTKKDNPKKKLMVQALEKQLGVVTLACKQVDLARNTHYEWLKSDPEYAKACSEIAEVTKDFVEAQMIQQIKSGDPGLIKFFLKTKAKDRGYVEKQEIEVSGKPVIQLIKPDAD